MDGALVPEKFVPRDRGAFVAVSAVVGVAAVVAVLAWWLIPGFLQRQNWQEQVAAYESQVESAEAESASSRVNIERDYTEAAEALIAEIARGEELYADSDDRVAQDDLRMELLLATNQGQSLLASGPTYLTETVTVPAISADGTRVQDSRPNRSFTVTTGTTPAVAEIQAATSRLTAAVAAVTESQQQWATTTEQAKQATG